MTRVSAIISRENDVRRLHNNDGVLGDRVWRDDGSIWWHPHGDGPPICERPGYEIPGHEYLYIMRHYDRRNTPSAWLPSEFQIGAIEAAFFTCDPFIGSGEYDLDWNATWNTLHPCARAQFVEACGAVERARLKSGRALGDILSAICDRVGRDMQAMGRDWYYTSQGHGVGLWEMNRWRIYADMLTAQCKARPLPEIHADVDCDHFRETGDACRECEGCQSGATYSVE